MPGEVPAGAGNAAPGEGAALHPRRPEVGSRRGEDGEGELPQGKAVGPAVWRGSRQVEGYVGGAAETQRESARLGAYLGGNHERITCGICTTAVIQGHRVVRLPRGDGKHVTHARCVLVESRSERGRRQTQAPLVCSERGCGSRHGKTGGPRCCRTGRSLSSKRSRCRKEGGRRGRRGTPPRAPPTLEPR